MTAEYKKANTQTPQSTSANENNSAADEALKFSKASWSRLEEQKGRMETVRCKNPVCKKPDTFPVDLTTQTVNYVKCSGCGQRYRIVVKNGAVTVGIVDPL